MKLEKLAQNNELLHLVIKQISGKAIGNWVWFMYRKCEFNDRYTKLICGFFVRALNLTELTL